MGVSWTRDRREGESRKWNPSRESVHAPDTLGPLLLSFPVTSSSPLLLGSDSQRERSAGCFGSTRPGWSARRAIRFRAIVLIADLRNMRRFLRASGLCILFVHSLASRPPIRLVQQIPIFVCRSKTHIVAIVKIRLPFSSSTQKLTHSPSRARFVRLAVAASACMRPRSISSAGCEEREQQRQRSRPLPLLRAGMSEL